MKEKVLVIGGAESQCHAIDILQKMDKFVIAADYDERCMGASKADLFVAVSTADVERLVQVAQEHNVSAVLSVQSDLGMLTASKIAKKLELKGIPMNVAELFTNKLKMRDFLKEKNYLYPEYRHCFSKEDIDLFAKKAGFPFIMKPLDSQGSRGVNIITSQSEFEKIEESLSFNREEEGVIVEEFLGKEEYTVEGIVVEGKHYTLAVSKKSHYENLNCVSNELYYSWDAEYENLIKMHNGLIEKTGLPFGITHSEYIKTNKGFVLVEFAARGGGSMIASHIVPAVSGCDVEEIYIKQILGEKVQIPALTKKFAVLKFLSFQEKKIKKIQGLEDIKKMENVICIHLNYAEGESVKAVENDTNRHGFYIAWADTEKKLSDVMKEVEDTLWIEYEE